MTAVLQALLPYTLTFTNVMPPLSVQSIIFTLNPFCKKHCWSTKADSERSVPEVQAASVKLDITTVPDVIVKAVGAADGITVGTILGAIDASVGVSVGIIVGGEEGTTDGGPGHSTALPSVHDTALQEVPNCADHTLG